MIKRTLIVAAILLGGCATSLAVNLDAQIFPLSGEVRFRNNAASPVNFVYYVVTSPSGALNGANGIWKSVTDVYDMSGNAFIDPLSNWTEISSLATNLTEGAFTPGSVGTLAAFRSVSLGSIWNSALYPAHDLSFTVLQADMSPVTVTVVPSLAGDYNGDLVVDGLDYTTWRQSFGSTTALAADGDLNGVVDADDYVLWRKYVGLSLPSGSGAAMGAGNNGGTISLQFGSSVPEPGVAALIAGGALAILTARGRARCSARRATRRASLLQ